MNPDTIVVEIKKLERVQSILEKLVKQAQKECEENQDKIMQLYKQFPKCSCCGRHKIMIIATQYDVDNYVDNEVYSGPKVGEYYCGC